MLRYSGATNKIASPQPSAPPPPREPTAPRWQSTIVAALVIFNGAGTRTRRLAPGDYRAAGLTYRRPHVLRHTFASLLIQAGEPITYVARRLGHHSPAFTMRVYGHFVPQGERRAVDTLDGLGGATIRNPGATAPVDA